MSTTYSWKLLRAGRFLLDGGGMFGIIPRSVWTRSITPDEQNRIELMHNCLLLEGGGRTVVIEAGTGDKLDPKMAGIFGLDGRTVESEVRAAGTDPADVNAVLISHLHFDHAGGLTRRVREGETPDWTAGPREASGDSNDVKLTFPNAEVIVQKQEWTDAANNDAVMTRTYYKDHLLPLQIPLEGERQRLRLVESPIPFPVGHHPHRNESPLTPITNRMTEVLPGISVFLVPGHTRGQQAICFTDDQGRTIVFTPDVMPTHYHVGQPYSLGYDIEPYTSMVTKRWLLSEAADRGWHLLLDHEPGEPLFKVERTAKGWFELVNA